MFHSWLSSRRREKSQDNSKLLYYILVLICFPKSLNVVLYPCFDMFSEELKCWIHFSVVFVEGFSGCNVILVNTIYLVKLVLLLSLCGCAIGKTFTINHNLDVLMSHRM